MIIAIIAFLALIIAGLSYFGLSQWAQKRELANRIPVAHHNFRFIDHEILFPYTRTRGSFQAEIDALEEQRISDAVKIQNLRDELQSSNNLIGEFLLSGAAHPKLRSTTVPVTIKMSGGLVPPADYGTIQQTLREAFDRFAEQMNLPPDISPGGHVTL